MNLIIIGAPGSGKGTQAEFIVRDFGVCHISTGNMLREAIKNGTKEGKEAEKLIAEGKLVGDDVIFNMLGKRVLQDDCKNGFLLDGVPRNLAQIDYCEKLGIDCVVYIDVDFNAIIKRLTSRKTCRDCGGTFIDSDCIDNRCPKCHGEVYQRADDTKEVIEKRLKTYTEQTAPVVDYYKNTGKLVKINGNQPIDKVYADINCALKDAQEKAKQC
ncbi:MAG: adenylate kinase [Clostridia bacterium]|nr:adenylate kinase [Clostridia bacterium]